jgi:uncharacterized protein YecA (UPF0149 family)
MYKAIKENKIIAINESSDFPCLIYDEIIEDTEHNLEDYAQYEGEFILKKDIPAPTEEEQKENRARAYQAEVDPITSHIQRLRDEEQTEEIIAEIESLVTERTAKVEEIKQRYPYPEGEDESDSID